jgi:heat shock protein HslJ
MRPLVLIPLAFALSACTPSNPPASSRPPTTAVAPAQPPAAALDAQALAAAHWRLTGAVDAAGRRIEALFPAADQRLQLEFSGDRLSVSGGCNRMTGRYALTGERFEVGALAQTKKFCGGGALMAADDAIGARLAVPGTLVRGDGGTLVLTTAGGDRLTFSGEPTAAARHGGEGERVFLEVAPQRVPCPHAMIPDHRCLHVRELRYDANGLRQGEGEWRFLYQEIEGYTHAPGVRNVLRVDRFDVADPPADGSSVAWVLDMVVESETVAP